MRVTNNLVVDRFLRNLMQTERRLSDIHEQLSTGRRINEPSDDPVGISNAMRLRTTLKEVEQYKSNIGEAKNWLEITEGALANATDTLHRARDLTVQAASGSLDQQSLDGIGKEIQQLMNQLAQSGNTTYGDRFIFSGDMNAEPYPSGAAATPAQGNASPITREIVRGVNVTINLSAQDAFDPAIQALQTIDALIQAGDTEGISNQGLAELDAAMDNLLAQRAEVGARYNRLELAEQRMADTETTVTSLLSDQEDVDMARAIMDLQSTQAAYNTALAAGARIIQPTLVDFLR